METRRILEPQELREQQYREHLKREGRSQTNENPDGCYFCGSGWHHSDDCPDREPV